jgi:acyl-coenzyme A thioesterase PaaI-like protein
VGLGEGAGVRDPWPPLPKSISISLQKVKIPINDNYCFVCGRDNPRGLKIKIKLFPEERAAETELALPREYQGWADVIHGGILSTLLDEMMAQAVWHFAGPGLTLNMEVRFHHPLKPDEAIRVRGIITAANGSRRTAAAEITRSRDNRKIASAKSRFLLLNKEKE